VPFQDQVNTESYVRVVVKSCFTDYRNLHDIRNDDFIYFPFLLFHHHHIFPVLHFFITIHPLILLFRPFLVLFFLLKKGEIGWSYSTNRADVYKVSV
jgi:hypothetical protein